MKKEPIYVNAVLPVYKVHFTYEEKMGKNRIIYAISDNMDYDEVEDLALAGAIAAEGLSLIIADMSNMLMSYAKDNPKQKEQLSGYLNEQIKTYIDLIHAGMFKPSKPADEDG